MGVVDHVTSGPPPIVSPPLPDLYVLTHPSPWFSIGATSGGGPTNDGGAAPWVFPKVCPPAMSATVSSVVHRHSGE